MSEEEFWSSSLAKVTALSKARKDLDMRRDYFVAYLASAQLASGGVKTSIQDILSPFYPLIIKPRIDPNRGAETGPEIKEMLKLRKKGLVRRKRV